ncbi:MAG: DUF433 domain-containing protein [Chlorobiales bacterium]|nr:DUF433 domain-containing protein [Chlorobiales bacterium]
MKAQRTFLPLSRSSARRAGRKTGKNKQRGPMPTMNLCLSTEEILTEMPDLEAEDLQACLQFASR